MGEARSALILDHARHFESPKGKDDRGESVVSCPDQLSKANAAKSRISTKDAAESCQSEDASGR
jgi:hypothetical protein